MVSRRLAVATTTSSTGVRSRRSPALKTCDPCPTQTSVRDDRKGRAAVENHQQHVDDNAESGYTEVKPFDSGDAEGSDAGKSPRWSSEYQAARTRNVDERALAPVAFAAHGALERRRARQPKRPRHASLASLSTRVDGCGTQ